MHRTLVCVIAAMAATISAHAEDTTAPNLDIAGIKVGMGVNEAMAALKAENPHFYITTSSHQLEGFSEPLHPFASGQQMIGPNNDGEGMSLLFTMPPGREVVWGIKRDCNYRAENRPSTENTLAALRAKYGSENIPPGSDPRTQNLAWVFDDKGKLLPADKAKQVYMSCCGILQNHFGNTDDLSSFSDIQLGRYGPPECSSIILITASVQSTPVNPGSSQLVVYNLSVQINHGPMYGAAIEATREIALRAARSRENKDSEGANKVGAPKL
jgi:hypothetical protein